MRMLHVVIAIDSHVGRVDTASLDEQTMMELLIGGFHLKSQQAFRDENGDFRDVCAMPGVMCDSDLRVNRLYLTQSYSAGTFETQFLPRGLVELNIQEWTLLGTFCAATLPPDLEICVIRNSQISGTFDFSGLPASVSTLQVNASNLEGTVDLTELPPALGLFYVCTNKVTGGINLEKLPQSQISEFVQQSFYGERVPDKAARALA